MFYLVIYRYDWELRRLKRTASFGFVERAAAEDALRLERAHLERTGQRDASLRLCLMTEAGEFIDAPDAERDEHYADRAALARLTGEDVL
jgi:hypothetical protein